MWKPITLQPNPARPNRPTYGVDDLAMVPTFKTREAFQAFTGEQAPPFDPDAPVKRWYITHAVSGPVDAGDLLTLQTYDTRPEVPVLRSFRIGGAEAASINLPGAYVYPAAVVAPSGAFYMLNGEKQYVSAQGLATWEDAKRIGVELMAAGYVLAPDSIRELDRVGMFSIGYESDENRRLLHIQIKGELHNVGALMRDQYNEGIGAPGAWSSPDSGIVDWIPAPVRERVSTRGEVPTPMRALENGESWQRLPFGLQILNAADAAGASEMNEKNMADNVAEIKRGVDKILAFFAIS